MLTAQMANDDVVAIFALFVVQLKKFVKWFVIKFI